MKGIRRPAGLAVMALAGTISLASCTSRAPGRAPSSSTSNTASGTFTPGEVGGTNLSGNKYVGPNETYKTIQAAVNAAGWGETIVVRAGTYREKIYINKSIKLLGERGAIIEGSDVISNFWREGNNWVTNYGNPRDTSGGCKPGSNWRCSKADQVFVDGQPLFQETDLNAVGTGDFWVGNGKLYLGTDPTNKTVEVSTRDAWIVGQGPSDVTIKGLTFRHAATPTQSGGLQANGPRWTIEGNDISWAHSTGLSINGDGTTARGNYIHHNGQSGITGRGSDMRVEDNQIAFNNTEEYDVQWEASGAKFVGTHNLTVSGNQAFDNDGPGLWCDIGCDTVTFAGNNVHHNKHQGIHFEVSSNAVIRDNVAWENGHDYALWPLGSGILVQNSSNVQVYNNTVAWNADGIGLIQGSRGDRTLMQNNYVHDNVIAGAEGNLIGVVTNADGSVFQDWTNNKAYNNRFYKSGSANWTYANRDYWDVNQLNASSLGGGSSLLGKGDLDAVLNSKSVPLNP